MINRVNTNAVLDTVVLSFTGRNSLPDFNRDLQTLQQHSTDQRQPYLRIISASEYEQSMDRNDDMLIAVAHENKFYGYTVFLWSDRDGTEYVTRSMMQILFEANDIQTQAWDVFNKRLVGKPCEI